jgi:hypothetical protein
MRARPWRQRPARPVHRPAQEETNPGMAVLSRFTAGAFGSLSGHYAGLCPPGCGHSADEPGEARHQR